MKYFLIVGILLVSETLARTTYNDNRLKRSPQQNSFGQPLFPSNNNNNENNFDNFDNDDILTGTFNPPTRQPPVQPSSSSPAPVLTEPTPRTLCEQQCPTPPQYNPVCGTDGRNYMNQAQLQCAQRCGRNVQVRHVGNCRSN